MEITFERNLKVWAFGITFENYSIYIVLFCFIFRFRRVYKKSNLNTEY